MRRDQKVLMLLTPCLVTLASCGDLPEAGVEEVTSAIKFGAQTTARPEALAFMIKWPSGNPYNCSGTLIGNRHVLTAAHCVKDEGSGDDGFTISNFQFRGAGTVRIDSPTACPSGCPTAGPCNFGEVGTCCDSNFAPAVCAQQFTVDRVFPQGSHSGADDLAVARLTNTVPTSVANPAAISSRQPLVGETLTAMGYGCSGNGPTYGRKMFVEYSHSSAATHNYCNGDSGSATFLGLHDGRGEIVRVASGVWWWLAGTNTTNDIGADPVTYRDRLIPMVVAMELGGISYRSHVEGLGWQAAVTNGATTGTTGQGRRLEGIQIWSASPGVVPAYRAYVEGVGWQGEFSDGNLAGTMGQQKRMEAIQIRLAQHGSFSNVRYRAHVQGIGWQPFIQGDQACTLNSQCATNLCASGKCAAGTTGQARRIEALQIQVF